MTDHEARIVRTARMLAMARAVEEHVVELDDADRYFVATLVACRAEDAMRRRGVDVSGLREQARGLAAVRARCES